MSLSALAISETVGYPTTATMFNDVEKFSPWPARLYIKKVSKITLYTGCTVVNGIEISYDMSNSNKSKTVIHGKMDGDVNECILTGDEFFIGFFGATDNKEPGTLRRVGFLVYNKVTGDITSFGAFPSPRPESLPYQVRGFSSLGLIAGFSGSIDESGKLDTLAVYKFLSADNNIRLSAKL